MNMFVRIEIDDGVARLILHHPPVNILTRAVLTALREALEQVEREPDVRVLILASEGKHFSAGADVGEHLPPDYQDMIPEFMTTVSALLSYPQPVIAAVQGKCLGGAFELVQAADIIVASDHAAFGQPEIVLGVFPPAACVLLPDRCGGQAAAELLLTGEIIDATHAAELGIVRHVVPEAALDSAVSDLARRMTTHSGAALRLTKTAMRLGGRDYVDRFAQAAAVYMDDLMRTDDALEGLRAFVEKRQPVWQHR